MLVRSVFFSVFLILMQSYSAFSAVLWSKDGHEILFNGYFRLGTGTTDGGSNPVCFWAPGASWKYRLGNECDNYADLGAHIKVALPDNALADYLKYVFRTPITGEYGDSIIPEDTKENYVEIGGVAGTSAKVWFGRKEALLRDIYITDYYYMNIYGDGFGVYDIPAGSAKMSYSFTREELYSRDVKGTIYQHNHSVGISEIKSNENGSLALDFLVSSIFDDGTGDQPFYDATGWAVAIRHGQNEVWGGYNTFVLQYGRGAARAAFAYPHEAGWVSSQLPSVRDSRALESAQTWRALDVYFREKQNWAVMGLALVEYTDSFEFDGKNQIWASVGARPMWFFGDHWRLVGEVGLDYVYDRSDNTDGFLLKQSAAIEWTPESKFFSRPAFRAYLTRADWSPSFRGEIGWPVHTDGTSGWAAGLQVEYWW